jgi:hypothetical protein
VGEKIEGTWRNNKTGDLYLINDGNVIDATNATNGEVMVLYRKAHHNPPQQYVREKAEFLQKFTKVR